MNDHRDSPPLGLRLQTSRLTNKCLTNKDEWVSLKYPLSSKNFREPCTSFTRVVLKNNDKLKKLCRLYLNNNLDFDVHFIRDTQ